jgi:hypothetical protein
MSNHISEELPRLLTGDASRDVVMAAAEHLRSCPDCQQELVSAVVAHASLTSAQRFAPEIVAPQNAPRDISPFNGGPGSGLRSIGPQGVAPLDVDADADGVSELPLSRHAASEPDVHELPNMSSMFAQIREEASAKSAAKPSRRPHRLLAVAAAAVVLAGGGTAIAEIATHHTTTSSRHVALAAFQDGKDAPYHLGAHAASATISGNKVTVDASGLPRLSAEQQYEVWLTDAQRQHMASIGFIGTKNNKAALTVPAKVKLSEFTDIEVSVQPVGNSSYSKVSVVRGSYGT